LVNFLNFKLEFVKEACIWLGFVSAGSLLFWL
jgi:hypothetical protein